MVTTQDASVGLALESTFRTGVTPTRWLEFIDESLNINKNVKQGQGLRVGSRFARSGRRTIPTLDATGDINMEVASKGMGLLWQLCMGSSVSTLVSAGTYQQVHTAGDVLPSATVQVGLPRADTGIDAYTYLGTMVSSWELGFPNDDILSLKVSLDAADLTTATAYAAPSYPAAPVNLFHFAGGSILTGSLVLPGATTLTTGGTPVAGVRSGSLSVNNNLANGRYNYGGGGRKDKSTVGLREAAGSLEVEYVGTAFRDAVINDSSMNLLLNFTAGSLSTGLETLQVVVPEIRFDNNLPQSNGTDLIVQSLNFGVLQNDAGTQPLTIVQRTADATL